MNVEAFLQTYVDAFVREDVEAVVACWQFPAIISTPAATVVLDEPMFRKNTATLFRFYRDQGMADATSLLSGFQSLGAKVASVTVDYELRDRAGTVVAAWRNGYLLREAGGAIHAIAAVADAELEAWAARGTPLGASEDGALLPAGAGREESVG